MELRSPRASQVPLMVKNPLANAEDTRGLGSIPGSGRSPGGGHGNSVQYSCLEMTEPTDHAHARCPVEI